MQNKVQATRQVLTEAVEVLNRNRAATLLDTALHAIIDNTGGTGWKPGAVEKVERFLAAQVDGIEFWSANITTEFGAQRFRQEGVNSPDEAAGYEEIVRLADLLDVDDARYVAGIIFADASALLWRDANLRLKSIDGGQEATQEVADRLVDAWRAQGGRDASTFPSWTQTGLGLCLIVQFTKSARADLVSVMRHVKLRADARERELMAA